MFSKDAFALFWSVAPDAVDWSNLAASGCSRVQMMLSHAAQRPDVTARLAAMGVRLVLRAEEESLYHDGAPVEVVQAVLRVLSTGCTVDAVVVGCEPENGYSMEYGAPTWGQQHAYEHRRRFDDVRIVLQSIGIRVVSPGWTMRSISEGEPAQPGTVTWREICCLPTEVMGHLSQGYLDADGCGVHLYAYNWNGPVDELRLLFALKWAASLFHRPLFLDEVGVAGGGSNVEKMAAYIDMAELIMGHPLGKRVELLAPFVANGTPDGSWDERYIIRDPAAYRLLGDWTR